MLRPDPNFWDSSHHRIFDFGIWITGESESIFQFWDFLRIFQQNLAFFNKILQCRWPNFKIFFPYYAIFQQNLIKILQNQANHWQIPDSNLEKKIWINPKSLKKWDLIRIRGTWIRIVLNTNLFTKHGPVHWKQEWRWGDNVCGINLRDTPRLIPPHLVKNHIHTDPPSNIVKCGGKIK